MSTTKFTLSISVALLCLAGGLSSAQAAIYTEDFNGLNMPGANINAVQDVTGLPQGFGGTLTGWTQGGGNTIHAVQLTPSPDWSVMMYSDNWILSDPISGANANGTNYDLTFDYGTANYGACCFTDGAQGDAVLVEVWRASDNAILATQTYAPGSWGVGNYNLDAGLVGTLSYVGDGTGDVKIYISTFHAPASTGRFDGSIDNLSLDAAVPEPSSFVLAAFGACGALCFLRRRRTGRSG